jgi:hypothetical protein
MNRDHIHPYFPQTIPDLWVIESSVSVSQKMLFRIPKFPVLEVLKYSLSDNVHESCDFPTVGENFCRGRTEGRLSLVGAPGKLIISHSVRQIFF